MLLKDMRQIQYYRSKLLPHSWNLCFDMQWHFLKNCSLELCWPQLFSVIDFIIDNEIGAPKYMWRERKKIRKRQSLWNYSRLVLPPTSKYYSRMPRYILAIYVSQGTQGHCWRNNRKNSYSKRTVDSSKFISAWNSWTWTRKKH